MLAKLGGTVVRRSAADVRAEMAAAEDARGAAKKKAREQLRDAGHAKQKGEIDAKLAELRAKLTRQKTPTAAS